MSNCLEVKYENKFCYNIFIEKNWDRFLDNIIKIYSEKSRKFCIVTDSNVSDIYLSTIYDLITQKYNDCLTIALPSGESEKTLDNIHRLYDVLISKKFQRGDVLIALGGGVIGDMTGFAASTYLRGIDFIQVPTTLLSQVDSSIGGKTGVDFKQYKNMIGAFHMPKMVYINTSVLNTLDKSQFSSGMGEVIKHGLIRNPDYFNWIFANKTDILSLDSKALNDMILESCKIKRDVVEEDPKELGIRAILNFGHTIGHAIEKCSEYRLFHGHCVAIGSVAAAYLSYKRNHISKEDYDRILVVFKEFGLPVKAYGIDKDDVFLSTKSDKKMAGSNIKFVLLNEIGDAYIDTSLTDEELKEAIDTVIE